MKDKLLQIRVSTDDLYKLDSIAKSKSRTATVLGMIEREYDRMKHSDIIQEFDSYPQEVQEALYKYASGDGYDHAERSVMLFRFFERYFRNITIDEFAVRMIANDPSDEYEIYAIKQIAEEMKKL